MSYASAKGYIGEYVAQQWLETELNWPLVRPRAGTPQDRGDLVGLPFTISVKNRNELALAEWVDQMAVQAGRNDHPAGVVIHKRRGRGSPGQWYVSTSGALWLPMAAAYVASVRADGVTPL